MAKKETVKSSLWVWLALTRVLLGVVFLWAFVDKLFGLGFATPATKSWLNGGSPTSGFLSHVQGPFADFFNSLSGQAWADWLFMAGLLGIGLALVLGIAVRLAAWSGVVLLVLMWAASLPLENNPVIDEHLVYAAALLAIAAAGMNQRYSLAGWWRTLGPVKKNAWLQ